METDDYIFSNKTEGAAAQNGINKFVKKSNLVSESISNISQLSHHAKTKSGSSTHHLTKLINNTGEESRNVF